MKIGLIGAYAVGGEHYFNLIEGIIDKSIDEVVLCDNNPALKPESHPRYANLYLPKDAPGKDPQALNNIYKNRTGKFPVFYEDYKAMLDNEQLDAVIIGTPQYLHAEMAVETLSRKIPTLCEKPLGVSLKEVEKILSAAKENETLLQIGLELRYLQTFEFLREKLRENCLGKIKMAWGREFRGDWRQDPMTAPADDNLFGNWRFSNKHTGGAILEKLCHDLDMFSWLIDSRPIRATGYGGINFFNPDGRDTIDNAVFIVEYANKAKLSFEYCMFAPYRGRFKGRYMGLIGEKGMFDIDERIGEVIHYETERPGSEIKYNKLNPETLPGHHNGNCTLFAFRDFCEHVKRGAKIARHNPEDVWITTKLCLALEESIKNSGKTIELDTWSPSEP